MVRKCLMKRISKSYWRIKIRKRKKRLGGCWRKNKKKERLTSIRYLTGII
jgi:hypothetical protein